VPGADKPYTRCPFFPPRASVTGSVWPPTRAGSRPPSRQGSRGLSPRRSLVGRGRWGNPAWPAPADGKGRHPGRTDLPEALDRHKVPATVLVPGTGGRCRIPRDDGYVDSNMDVSRRIWVPFPQDRDSFLLAALLVEDSGIDCLFSGAPAVTIGYPGSTWCVALCAFPAHSTAWLIPGQHRRG
jgi:hypothetical protein